MSTFQDVRKIHALVTHKLRIPVMYIYNSMTLLDSEKLSPESAQSVARVAWQGTKALVNNVQDILQYIDAPMSLKAGTPARLKDVPALINSTSKTLELEDVTVSVEHPLATAMLNISMNSLELTLYELLENSKKFHPDLTPSIRVVIQAPDKNNILLRILDNGQTMTATQLAQAKLPYMQAEKWFTGQIRSSVWAWASRWYAA
jgi:K+-sensing histidine kinase KdpD